LIYRKTMLRLTRKPREKRDGSGRENARKTLIWRPTLPVDWLTQRDIVAKFDA